MADINELMNIWECGGGLGGGGPQGMSAAQAAVFGAPALDTTANTDSAGNTSTLANTCTLFHRPGKVRVVFGRRNPLSPNTLLYPTLPITDDGSTGSGLLKLLTWPKGIVVIKRAYANIPVLIGVAGGNWTMTTAIMSVGSAAAGTDATLTSTEQDILAASTLKALTYTSNARVIGSAVSGAKTAAVEAVFTQSTSAVSPPALAALTDNTGGTSNLTLASGSLAATPGTLSTIVTGATVVAATQNVIATLAAQVEEIRRRTEGVMALRYDGTTTATSIWLNFAVNSDPTAAQTIQLGYIAAGSEFVRPAGYLDIEYGYNSGASSTAIFDVAPPLHGAGGG